MYNAVSGETVSYTYDSLNRLLTANGSGWNETYGYDGFGNLTSKSGSPANQVFSVDPTTNRLGGTDANGNAGSIINGSTTVSLYYDAENRMNLASTNGGAHYVGYAYDAQNRRIYTSTGAADSNGDPTNYAINVYTPGGQKLGAYNISILLLGQSPYTPTMQVALTSSDTYFGARRLAPMDQLGSAGNNNYSAGTYYPWGEPKGSTNPQDAWSYATYWTDSFSSLDYANNRYYSNAYGRFMTPDPYQATATSPSDPSAPQSWNRYAYVQGDPINYNDPSGQELGDVGDQLWEDPGFTWGPCDSGAVMTFIDGVQMPSPCDFLPIIGTAEEYKPPPCQAEHDKVYQTLEGLGTNILSIAEQKIQGLSSQDISALTSTIQSDIQGEFDSILVAGDTTSPPYFKGGHYNLDITNQDITNDLGPILGQQFIKDFTVGLFGTLDGVRQSAPNQPGYTLHSKKDGSQLDFHFDRFGYRNLLGHWGYDYVYGSLSHACLDPAWQH